MTDKISKNTEKQTIIISAVNIVEGGALTVLQECIKYLAMSYLSKKYDIIVIVNSINRLQEYDNIRYIEYPKAKKHYIYRLYYEYIAFKRISQKYKTKLWLSLHDMSPCVCSEVQAVYMHNPSPFYKPTIIDWKFIPITAIWAYLYKFVYRINIHSNKYLVVQQSWLRNEFSDMFKIPKEKIIVARPNSTEKHNVSPQNREQNTIYQFVYPALPRVFKNFEVICEAARILEKDGYNRLRIVLTINGSENKYSHYLLEKYGNIKMIDFIGLVDKSKMEELYGSSNCLIFPSKLETWGLPLSEFKPYNRPIIVADLPYAHESVAGAKKVFFFPPDNASVLADVMKNLINGDDGNFMETKEIKLDQPYTSTWKELFRILLS